MSHKLSVILLDTIPDVGRPGDIVEVAEGFARNQLFPQGKAALAESPSGKQALKSRATLEREKNAMLAQAQKVAEQLEGTELILKARLKEDQGDEIFGSISAKSIAEELTKQTKHEFAPKQIKLKKPFRMLGTAPVTVVVAAGIECQIQVTVVEDEEA